ncbi:hypothetical protein [Sporisorium scitamineum]|uniref:Uncharacterized protein n=1 Tax=Sporisorium scitamineum TaxID=49012 RepID=A0A0F7RZ56_9BASI|nr:hypothetical protein [Sporisorium scitamineum]
MKFSFLKPVEPLAVQIERFQWQKRKQAMVLLMRIKVLLGMTTMKILNPQPPS